MARPKGCLRLLVLSALVIGAVLAAAPLIPISPLKNAVELKLSGILGRPVSIASARLSFMGAPHLTLKGMNIQETANFGGGLFLKADEVRADFDLINYLRTRQLDIQTLTLRSPQINLVKNADGLWNWTTLGQPQVEHSAVSLFVSRVVTSLSISALLTPHLSMPAFKNIRIEDAFVKVMDRTGSGPAEMLYKNIDLSASLSRYGAGEAETGTEAKGEIQAQSAEEDAADLLKATLPFDLKIYGRPPTLSVSGSIGPGPVETKNLNVGAFSVDGEIHSNGDAPLTGNGRISATDMFIRTINLSEQVARSLKVDQIGDMTEGTGISSLETDFQIGQGAFNTTALKIQQLDGLGDATSNSGSFQIEAALTVNYTANLNLTPEATSRVKSISPMLGMLVTILETSNRLSVPINIRGDVRKPEIQVDVNRIF